MSMLELLEQDKERLLVELEAAGSPAGAVKVLENESDRLLFRYNEDCRSDQGREAASAMMQTARMAAPMADTAGDVKLYTRHSPDGRNRLLPSGKGLFLLLSGAAVLLAGALLPWLRDASGSRMLFSILLCVSGGILLYLSGYLAGRPAEDKKDETITEIAVDAGRLYRAYKAMILIVDQNLDRQAAQQRWEERSRSSSGALQEVPKDSIGLWSELLGAAYTKDGDYALEKLQDIRYYLHCHQIEVVDYAAETKDWFDLMPAEHTGTIRPALVLEGRVLARGLASGGNA